MSEKSIRNPYIEEYTENKKGNKFHKFLTDDSTSALKRYQDIVIGKRGLWELVKYEFIVFMFGSMPGVIGLALRKIFYPKILGHVGRNVLFCKNITIRHGCKISLGDQVVIGDNVVLDAKGEENDGIIIESDTDISSNCILSCKNGNIHIGRNVNLGMNSLIHAVNQSGVKVGDNAAIAAYTYLIGGGNYYFNQLDTPIKEQGTYSKGGVVIGEGAWMGSHVQVLDGVRLGQGSIVAAGAVVNRNVPDYAIVGGVPAKLIRYRFEERKL